MDTPEFANACAETPGCGAPQDSVSPATESLWRVQVVREASGDVRIERVEIIDVVSGDGVPIGPLAGKHALVGLDENGEVVDGQVLRFPEVRRVEYESSTVEEIDLAGKTVDTLVYIKVSPSITELVIRDRDGTRIDSTDVLPRPERLR